MPLNRLPPLVLLLFCVFFFLLFRLFILLCQFYFNLVLRHFYLNLNSFKKHNTFNQRTSKNISISFPLKEYKSSKYVGKANKRTYSPNLFDYMIHKMHVHTQINCTLIVFFFLYFLIFLLPKQHKSNLYSANLFSVCDFTCVNTHRRGYIDVNKFIFFSIRISIIDLHFKTFYFISFVFLYFYFHLYLSHFSIDRMKTRRRRKKKKILKKEKYNFNAGRSCSGLAVNAV